MCPSGTGYNYFLACLRHGRTNNFYHSNRQRQRKAVLAQSGERQRSGKRRLREGKRTAANRHSALRKCRNAVSAGVLSPISSAVGRNGAVGDKESARAGARNSPLRRGRGGFTPLRGDASSAPFGGTCLPAGRSAGLTGHRPVIQHRDPSRGKANGGVSFNTANPSRGKAWACAARAPVSL